MSDVIIFGGTTEGRLLAEFCADQGIRAMVSVVSDYGKQVLPHSPWLTISRKAMSEEEMVSLIQKESPKAVMDATHPYASVVTEHVYAACQYTGVPYIRITRAESAGAETVKPTAADTDKILWMETVSEAVTYLAKVEGTIFVTTGSKELERYTNLPDYSTRLYARILPGSENLAGCEALGIRGKHVIAMQGPFSREMNTAMLRHTGARYLVTKEGGCAGGFLEKIEAALECGVMPIVIGRPKKPEGVSVEQGIEILREMANENAARPVINLIGIGMGGPGQLTQEAVNVLKHSDAVLGAARMIQSIEETIPGIRKEPVYLSRDVIAWLETHSGYKTVSVVYSGDTGFYSGAKTLLEDLKHTGAGRHVTIKVYPGISTVSYLCAKLHTSWDDACLVSAHGRPRNELELLKHHDKIFLLLGGENSVRNLCQKLSDNGYPNVTVSVGENLSYPDEKIVTGTAEELKAHPFGSLAAVLIRQ